MNGLRRWWGGSIPLSGPAAAIAASFSAGDAEASVADRLSLSLSGSNGYATNAFLREGDGAGAGFVTVTVTPGYQMEDERGQVQIEATLRATRYLSAYGNSYSYGLRTAGRRQLNDAATLTASAGVESSIVGQERAFTQTFPLPSPAAQLEPRREEPAESPLDILIDTPIPDLALAGRRRTSLNAELGAIYRIGVNSSLTASIQASKLIFPGDSFGIGSRSLSGSASYSRRISAAASAGVSGVMQRTVFGRGRGSSTIYRPQVFFEGRTYSGWTLNLAAGGLFIRPRTGEGGGQRSSGFSGDASVCRRGIRTSICFGATRGAEESGLGVVNELSSIFTRLTYRLSEHEDVSVGAGASKTKAESTLRDIGRRQQRADASYRRRFSERLEIGVTAAYQDIYGGERPIDADFRAVVTFGIRLG